MDKSKPNQNIEFFEVLNHDTLMEYPPERFVAYHKYAGRFSDYRNQEKAYKSYKMLCAIASNKCGCTGRAIQYLTMTDEKEFEFLSSGEGSFMSAVLHGDTLKALWLASKPHRNVLLKAMMEDKLELPELQR